MLWTAPATGIEVCHIAVLLDQPLKGEPSYVRGYYDWS